ncbi:hypothetical protein SAMN02745121_00871 [Nannocystis exedens]|uniref:Lipoprotein n=1 Tax=Nannocystis exedens TaxID=54 RepID=A0A1I1U0N2_9BACT|nr:hypothetical protein [Nannocystis exedens]PCC71332.1 hypothetical protein NAEX_04406 [Nannocystis exedens]SFD64372.1 hypothetical protein SAMN02745121_00871 [Nannocystis exedens]
MTRVALAAALVGGALSAGGCEVEGESGESGGSGGSGESETGEAEAASVAGTVTRTVDVAPGNDGKGTLFVAALDVCDLTGGGKVLGVAVVADADLAGEDAAVPFTIENLPRTSVQLALFLDDNGDAMAMTPRPGPGDLVYTRSAGDGVLDCVAVELGDGDVTDLELALNVLEE